MFRDYSAQPTIVMERTDLALKHETHEGGAVARPVASDVITLCMRTMATHATRLNQNRPPVFLEGVEADKETKEASWANIATFPPLKHHHV